MKVKIVKSNRDTYWYADKIGEIFEVLETRYDAYIVTNNAALTGRYIDMEDCEVVNEIGIDKTVNYVIDFQNESEYDAIVQWANENNIEFDSGFPYYEIARSIIITKGIFSDSIYTAKSWLSVQDWKEIKFSFKQAIDKVEIPVSLTPTQKEAAEIRKQMEELAERLKEIEGTL